MAKKRSKAKSSKKDKKRKKRKAWGGDDARQQRKVARGGRVEAYTMGEASKGKGFPW